jgi:acetyl-CoA C-acetyltransferase
MKEVVIAGYLRTAQSRSRPNDPARDWFCKMRSDELLAKLLPEAINRVGIDPKEVDDYREGIIGYHPLKLDGLLLKSFFRFV